MHEFFKRFLADHSGNVLMLTGLAFLFLVAIGGAGYDLGRQQLVEQRIQQASDAAALAAAAMDIGTADADRIQMAQQIYNLNFPAIYLGVVRPPPNITVNATQVQVGASTNVSTAFVRNFNDGAGPSTLATAGLSSVLIKRDKIDFDLVVVVDESGSTSDTCPACIGSRINTERLAIISMLDIIFPAGPVNPDVRFGLIGYTQHVSNKWGLTSTKADAINAVTFLNFRASNYDHYGMEAGFNMATGNSSATTPNGEVPYFMVDAAYDNTPPGMYFETALQPFRNCYRRTSLTYGIPSVADPCQIIPIEAAVRNVDTPAPRTVRSDGNAVSPVKNMIFITDGEIMEEPSGCSDGPRFALEPAVPGAPCPNYPRFLAECDKVKAAGINLFVISFASQALGDVATLRSCASRDPATGNPQYYFAPSGPTLNTILQDLGNRIIKVRIVQ
jgi:Flp pilus assembly protein TadG